MAIQGIPEQLAGKRTIRSMGGILNEMSLMPLHVGQPDRIAVNEIITRRGSKIWDIWPGYRPLQTCLLTQVDALYVKRR